MTSLNMERPPESASLREKHAFLEHQLDGLRGQEVLSRFTVLDGFSSRRRGGALSTPLLALELVAIACFVLCGSAA